MPLQKKKDKYENPSLVTRKEEIQSNTIQATAEQALRFRDAQRDTKKELVDSYQDQKRVQDLKKQQVREEKSSVMTGIRNSYEKYMREQGKMPYEDPGIDRMTQDRFGTIGYLNTGMIHSDPLYAAAIQAGGGSFKVADVEREKYGAMSSNADFNEYSTYVPTGVKRNPSTTMQMAYVIRGGKTASKDMDYDLLYDALNGDADAEKLWNSGIKKADYENAKYLTDDERKVFNYLYKKDGAESVDRYIGYMEPLLNERARKQNEADVSSFAAENPIAASALSVVASPFKIASTIGQAADYAIDGEVDQNSNYNMFSYLPNAIRNQVSEDIAGAVDDGSGSEANKLAQDAATFGYQTTLSILDNVLNMAIGNAFAAGGNPDTVRKAAGAASQIIMSSSAAADTMIDARDKGRSSDEALTVATVAGIAEWLTEKWSVEALLKDDIIRDNAVKYVAKNMLAEGSEEVASDLINTVADIIVLKDDSEWQRSIAEIKYEHPDWSNKKAFAYAVGQKALEVGVSFLGGAISGGILSGANVGRNIYYQTRLGSSVNNAKNSNDLLYSVAEEAIDNAKVMEDTASGKKETRAANAETKRADEFLQKVVDADDSNSKLSNREVGRQIQINDDNMVNTIAPKAYETNAVVGEAVNEAVNNSGNVSEETVLKVLDNDGAVQAISKATGKNLDGISLKEQIETVRDYIREGTRDYVNERIVNLKSDTMGELGSRVLRNNYQTSGIEDVQTYVENVDALYSYGAQLDRNVNVMTNEVVDAAIQSTGATINREVAHRAIIAGFNDIGNGNIELTGGSNGETNGDSGSGRIYRLAERKGSESTSGKRSKAGAGTSSRQERLRHVKDVVDAQIRTRNGQRVSSSELGFTDGTYEKRNVVLDDQAIEELGYTERVKDLERRTGAKVILVSGTMEQAVQHTDGKTDIINVRGSFDSATNTLIVQADNRNLDFEQIGLHEEFHTKFKNTNAAEHDRMINEIRDKIAGHDDAEFMALIEMYKDKYGWRNMNYSEEYIVEEILADAYAGIDVWDYLTPMLGATRYTDSVRNATAELLDAVENHEAIDIADQHRFSREFDAELQRRAEEENRKIDYKKKKMYVAASVMKQAGLDRAEIKGILDKLPAHLLPEEKGMLSGVDRDENGNKKFTVYGNSSYSKSVENTSVCIRSLAMERLFDQAAQKLGHSITTEEAITLSQMAWALTDEPTCQYCYVFADRVAERNARNEYIKQRDAAIEKLKKATIDHVPTWDELNYSVKGKSGKFDLKAAIKAHPELEDVYRVYSDFGAGRKNTENMQRRFARFVDSVKNGTELVRSSDVTTDEAMREAEKRGGVMADEIADIRRYASNASHAKAKVAYTAYNNDILEFSADLVIELNKEYGLRFYSYSDYHPAFLLENMQMYTDAAVKGLKGLAYTKDIDYARIFDPTGANINISTKAMDRPVRWDSLTESQKAEYSYMTPVDGMVYMPDAMQGANWAEAIALRQKSIENGTGISVIMVCTSDAQVEWAMKQEWCDVIIPYHVVFSQAIKDTFLWKNYKAWQEDKKIKGKWKEGNAKHITPIMHGNDLNTYLKALKENNLSPRFEQWLKKDPENYMKLVNETRRSYRDTQALQPIFNMEEARKVGEKLENGKGYDWFGHYLSENEDVADEFVDRYNAGERYNASVGGFTDKATADLDHDYAVAIDTLNSDTATKAAKKKAQKYLDNIQAQYGFNEAVEYDSNGNPVALSKRIQQAGGQRFSQEDSEYMELAKDPEKNEYRLDQMVGHAAFNAGYKQMMFHETSAENIHVFDISRGDHSATDSETPYGIFTKSRDNNIGIGDRQMKLYVKAENTLNVESREYVSKYIPDLVPYYDEIKRIDDKYGYLADKAMDMEMERLEAWTDAHPEADMEELLPLDYIIENKPAKIDDAAYLSAHKHYEDVMSEWTKASDVVRVKCKDIITDYLRDNGYDSMYLFIDAGSNGRQTDALIVLDENQVKSANTVTYDDNGNVIPLSERFNSGSNDIRFSIDESFLNQVDEWNANGRDDETVFTLGTTGNTLQALGAIENDIYMNSEKVNRILNDHPEMDVETIKLIPKIIDDPTLILNSKNTVRNPTRVVMFSSVKDTKGIPVLAVLDLRPVENGFVVDDMQKLTSAYGKNVNAVDFVKNSEVLFAKEKRIASLLRTIGFTMPMELKDNNPYVGSISYKGQNVNIKGKAFENVFAQTHRNSTEDSDGNALTDQKQEDDYIRYSREMDEQAKVNFGSMFSGTGTVDFALRNMVNHRFAVEYDRQIAGVFKSNNGDEIFIGDVRDAVKQGYLDDKDVEYFHASPVCKNFSSQKHDSGEQPLDISTAQAVADAIDSLGPKIFTLENVKGYRNSRAVNIVKDALTRNGYVFDEHVYRASDYGGSTIRERYFIRAVKDVAEMPPMPEKVQGMSWYDTVSDLIPELPEWPMKVGGYMETRWNAIKDQVDTSRPVLILRGTKGGSLVYAEADEFSPTIIASDSEARIFMPDGRVLRATPRVLARIQGLPDSFKLPTQTSLANKVIGNGIPVQLTQAVAGSLIGQVDGVNDIRFSQEDAGYHAGDLGKAESYAQQGYYRGTGHFGTGTYFVGDESLIEKYNMRNGVKAPHEKVDFSKYNLYRPGERLGLKLHEALKVLDGGIDSKYLNAAIRGEFQYREPEYMAYYDRLDKYRDEGLEWEDAKIAAYQDELNGIDPEEIEYEFKTYDEFFKNYSKGWEDIDEDDYEFYKGEYVDYLKAISEEYNEEDSAMYDRLRDAVFNLQMMFGFNKETEKALRDTLAYQEEMQNASYEKQKVSDSLATVFMKSLGYEGIDVRGTNLDNVAYGSVIYDLKGKDLDRKKAIGTARYSTESMSDAEQSIREENEYLKGAYASLLTEVRTDKRSASRMRTNANKTADRIREEYESRINKNDLRDRMNRLVQDYIIGGEQNESMAYQNAKNEAVDIARDIVNNAGRMKNADEYDRYLDLKKRVKNNDGIYLDPSLRGDQEKYQEIRKRLFGKVNLKNSGTPLDTFYQGLVNDFGELFDPDVAPGIDQLNRIEEVLNTLAPIYENPYNGRIAEAIELCANDILISLTDGTIVPDASSQNARQQARVEAARQIGIDYARKAIAAERVYEKKRIDNALAYYKNRDKMRLDSAERERLRRIANRLNNRKLPAATRALVEQYIGELDLISVKLTNKRLENLKDLRLWYDDQQVNNPDFVKDPEIEKLLQRLSTRQISELNIEEVRWLTTCLQNIENELATAKKTIDTEDQRDIHIQAEESMADIDHSKGNGNNAFTQGIDSFFVQGTLSPIRAMKRIVGYNTESPIYLRTLELEQGQIKSFDWQRKAEANFLKWTNDAKFMESIVGKKAKLINIGNGVKITPAMRMSLYLHSKNEQNMRHIIYGGVTVPNIKEYKSGNMSKAYGKGSQTIKLNAKQVNDIIAGMTDEEKAFANAAAKYFNGTSQESINEVSEKLKGYSLALVQNYFPINTNTNFTLADYETVKMDGTIEGMGFLKERQNASNPIYLRDMTDVLEKSITSTAKYVGLAIPVRNFNKLYNVSSSEFGDEAKAALEEMKNAKSLKDRYAARERMRNARELFTGSMRESVMQKWDIEGINYIEKMMADIQNPRGSRSAWAKMFGNIRSNYAGSVLSLSASVAMKQAASYPTAAAVLGWKPLGQAFADVFKLGKRFDMDLVNKYTPLLWHRASNFNVQYLGNVGSSVNQNRLQKLLSSKPLNWITDMDIATTRLLWYASEHYVQDNNKALVKGSDAYYKAVAEIYNRVITETQPNYTTMERPELLRTDDTLLSSMMMFKTQSFQNFNVLYDAIGNYNAKKDAVKVLNSDENKAALTDAKKGLLMASTSQVVQTFVFAAMTAVCAALMGRKDKYKDDEGEVTLESLSKQVGKDMISSAMSSVPFGGEIYNVLARVILGEKYYGFDNITASSLDDLFNAFIKASDSIKDGVNAITNKDGAEWDWNDQRINMDGILNAFTKAFGIPYDNASKIFEAIVQHVSSGVQGKYEGTYTYLRLTKKMSDTGAYYDNLFKAYENDKESYESLKKKMIEDGFDEEKIRNAMNSMLKKKAGVANVSDLDHKLVDPKYQDEYDEAINMLLKSPEYKKLSDEDQKSRRSAVESTLKDPDKMDEIEKAGLDIGTYSLYLTARKLADVQGDNNGSYTKEEKEAAVKMLLNSGEITSSDAAVIRKYGK